MTENYYQKIKDQFLVEDNSLFRFGSIDDGGYYLRPDTLKNSQLLFSGGISSNLEFEYDTFRFNDSINIVMIDPTVSGPKLILKGLARMFFKKQNKLRYLFNALQFNYLIRTSRCKHLKLWLKQPESILKIANNTFKQNKNILLKLDIEGSEYDFLDEVSANLDSFSALVFEFHDLYKKHQQLISFLESCSKKFDLVHLNINPSGGFDGKDNPKCVEVTLEKK